MGDNDSLEESFQDYDDESEYEYIDESDDEDGGLEKQENEACSSSLGTKRKATCDADQLLSNIVRERSMASSATNVRGFNTQGQDICLLCNREKHSPVTSCEIPSEWAEGNISNTISSSGITTWPSEYVLPSISFRIDECSKLWNLPKESVSVMLQQHAYDPVIANPYLPRENRYLHQGGRDELQLGLNSRTRLQDEHALRAHEAFMMETVQESRPPAPSCNDDATKPTASMNPDTAKPAASANVDATDVTKPATSTNDSSKNHTSGLCEQLCCKLASSFCCKEKMSDDSEIGTEYSMEASAEPKIACGICMENFELNDLYSLGCYHLYCSDCWHNYLQTSYQGNFGGSGALLLRCPAPSCDNLVAESHIRKIAPALIPRFKEHCLHAFIRANSASLRWCPGAGCNRIAVQTDMFFAGQGGCQRNTAICGGKGGCQTKFCFLCGEEPHDGPCAVTREGGGGFFEAAQQQTAQQRNDTNNTKRKLVQRCPRCKSPIEKNGGCNHMTCKCGCHFCWICNADITVNRAHYCGRNPTNRRGRIRLVNDNDRTGEILPRDANLDYVHAALQWEESQEMPHPAREVMIQNIHRKKEQMRSISHYYNRFVAHNQGQEFAMDQTSCVSCRADQFNSISGIKTATDRDFLADANKLLVLSRRVLKYSYCYAYHEAVAANVAVGEIDVHAGDTICVKDDHVEYAKTTRLSLFEDHQERLERFTEALSENCERAYSMIDRHGVIDQMEVVARSVKAVINFEIDYQPVSS